MEKENEENIWRRKRREIFGEERYLVSGGEGKGGKYLEKGKIFFSGRKINANQQLGEYSAICLFEGLKVVFLKVDFRYLQFPHHLTLSYVEMILIFSVLFKCENNT